jgi:hypothetical protein
LKNVVEVAVVKQLVSELPTTESRPVKVESSSDLFLKYIGRSYPIT